MGKPVRLAPAQRRALDRLSALPAVQDYYLAGGTAIALHLQHRRSLDLDLFSLSREANLDALRAEVQAALPEARVLGITDASLRIVLGDVPVDVVRYPYAPLDPPHAGPEGIRIAGLRDLAAMKLAAIARRGLRRDFWDLFAILHAGISLEGAASDFLQRFGRSEADLYHVLRALTYFEDAERDPVLPRGLSAARWEKIKAFFEVEAPKLVLRKEARALGRTKP
ncbi:MAG TPA: nucleotidyl transferase AbiEii/AbiGii toxin family protein [Candidatus Nanopelagicales bacterium]|nr:nucleotidyl transferase AbiEii/AbiGii toxin family protein [Candidatus Nanopelagicales bacterium]